MQFHAGLNLLTGETGSGKSIVVDALGLVLGGRASADMVRSDTERARVAAIFEAPREPVLQELLEQAGAPVEDGELIIEREVLAGGKSRAFLGNRPVTVALLREIAPFPGRHSRAARAAAAFFERGAVAVAGRIRGAGSRARGSGGFVSAVEKHRERTRGAEPERTREAADGGSVELPAQGDRRGGAETGRRCATGAGARGAAERREAAGECERGVHGIL